MIDTREYIIDQSFSLFMSRSYEAVSISDISCAIGLTKGALYHHFKNKSELFIAVVDKYFILNGIEVDEESVTLEKFGEVCILHTEKVLNKLFAHTCQFAPIDYMSFITDGFRHYPGFADGKIQFMNSETKKIKRILDRAVLNGEIRSDIDTAIIAHNYFTIMVGLAGNLIKSYSIEDGVNMLKAQFQELYKLLKV